jgi:hypothetical protein
MKTKKKASSDWADILLANSGLPADEFTMTTGNNFGLDGFQFDVPDNEGVERGAQPRMPEVKGLSALPDGFLKPAKKAISYQSLVQSDRGLRLGSDITGGKEASLVDLQWLDPTQVQDLSRLPDNEKTLNASPQLEEAWGKNRRTDGFGLIPNQDKDAIAYEKSMADGPKSGLPGNQLKEAILKATRRAHFGHSIQDIKQELVDTLGHDAKRAAKAVQHLEAEYGLLGNVYVLASVFPGIKNGTWVKELRRMAHSAQYVITDDTLVAEKLGKTMVSEVPWKEALIQYLPILKAAGYKLASGSPKEILKAAFLSSPEIQTPETNFVKDHQEARQKAQASAEDLQASLEQGQQKKVQARLLGVVKAGLLTTAEAQRIVGMNKSAKETHRIISAAVQFAGTQRELVLPVAETHKYAGTVQKAAQMKRISDAPPLDANQIRIQKLSKKSGIKAGEFVGLLKWARQQMSEGAVGVELDQLLESRFSQPLLKAAKSLLRETRGMHEGLSGHLYVDAEAYASPNGLTGCERGGLKHRANALKHVLAMPRCAGCVYVNANGVCQQYNKKIAKSAPVSKPEEYQEEAIRMANASDAEQLGSLFQSAHSSVYKNEFGLHNASLDSIEVEEHKLPESLGKVGFGGMEIEVKK